MPEAANGTNGANGTSGTSGATAAAADKAHVLPDDLRATLREFFDVNNVGERERKIIHDNAKLRVKNAQYRDQITSLESGTPKDGQVVLSKEDAALFADFKKLNVKPADVTAALTERDTLKTKQTELERETVFAEAAEALGFANTPLFVRTMQHEKLHVEFKDVVVENEDGEREKVRLPFARPAADDKKELVALDEYLEQELGPEMIAALEAEPAGENEPGATADEETDMAALRRSAIGASNGTSRGTSRRTTQEPVRGVRMPVTRGARPAGSTPNDKKRQEKIINEVRDSLRVRI